MRRTGPERSVISSHQTLGRPCRLPWTARDLASVLLVPRELPFSLRIIPAALGTAAVIAGVSANPHSGVGRMLASVPLVVIGKLSYSWYLWHWPLLALARVYDFDNASPVRDL